MHCPSLRSTRQLVAGAVAVFLLVVATGCASSEDGSRGEREPDLDSDMAEGPHDVATESVSADDVDFGGGTMYYPDDDATFPAIAAAPGRGADESMVSWYGDLLASNGFVVITFNSSTPEDSADDRGQQILGALDYLATDSSMASQVDPDRMGALGHSMGGGGALAASAESSQISAAVALTPYSPQPRDWSTLSSPTLIVGGDADEVTPNEEHAEPLYDELTNAEQRAYMNLNGDHFVANPPSAAVSEQVLAWFKLFINDDADYADVLCPAPAVSDEVIDYRDTCPHT